MCWGMCMLKRYKPYRDVTDHELQFTMIFITSSSNFTSSSSLVPRPLPAAILIKARKMVWELSAYSLAFDCAIGSNGHMTDVRLR